MEKRPQLYAHLLHVLMWISLTANLSTLDEGVQKIQFDNIINEFLSDRGVKDSVTKEAMIFQYTYWPQPQNQTMILRRTVDVSCLLFHSQQIIIILSLYKLF